MVGRSGLWAVALPLGQQGAQARVLAGLVLFAHCTNTFDKGDGPCRGSDAKHKRPGQNADGFSHGFRLRSWQG
jgi:hypothetical protein